MQYAQNSKAEIRGRLVRAVEKAMEIIIGALKANPSATLRDIAVATGLLRRGVEWNLKALKELWE